MCYANALSGKTPTQHRQYRTYSVLGLLCGRFPTIGLLVEKKACGFEGEIVFDTKYPDGDPVKILGNSKLNDILPNFEFFDHEQGIRNTVKYYEEQRKAEGNENATKTREDNKKRAAAHKKY